MVVFCGAVMIALIAITDWGVEFNATLGFLYLFPLVLLGMVLNWWQLILTALLCTVLSDRLDPFPTDLEFARDLLIFLTVATTGILSRGVAKGYRREMETLSRIESESSGSSPARSLPRFSAGKKDRSLRSGSGLSATG